ncbi:hypothetical protein RLOatenuis_3630 [Rickettsiales bacterium]|nr:hypothetical protein RLOatenuis_3630 [Rickettsiales bacterium]
MAPPPATSVSKQDDAASPQNPTSPSEPQGSSATEPAQGSGLGWLRNVYASGLQIVKNTVNSFASTAAAYVPFLKSPGPDSAAKKTGAERTEETDGLSGVRVEQGYPPETPISGTPITVVDSKYMSAPGGEVCSDGVPKDSGGGAPNPKDTAGSSDQGSGDADKRRPEEALEVDGMSELPEYGSCLVPPAESQAVLQEAGGDNENSELAVVRPILSKHKTQEKLHPLIDNSSDPRVRFSGVDEEIVLPRSLGIGDANQGFSVGPGRPAEPVIKTGKHKVWLQERKEAKQKELPKEEATVSVEPIKDSESAALSEGSDGSRHATFAVSRSFSDVGHENPSENLDPPTEVLSKPKEPGPVVSSEESAAQSVDLAVPMQEEPEKTISEPDQPAPEIKPETGRCGTFLWRAQPFEVAEESGLSKEQVMKLSELIKEDFASELSGKLQDSGQIRGRIGIGALKLPSESESQGFWRVLWWLCYILLFVPYSILNPIAKFFRGEKEGQVLVASDSRAKILASEEVEKLLGQKQKLLGQKSELIGGFILEKALEDQGAFFGPIKTDLVCVVTVRRAKDSNYSFADKEDFPRLLFFKHNHEGFLEGPIKIFCLDHGASNRREIASYCSVRQHDDETYEILFPSELRAGSAGSGMQRQVVDNAQSEQTYIQEAKSSFMDDRAPEDIARTRNVF